MMAPTLTKRRDLRWAVADGLRWSLNGEVPLGMIRSLIVYSTGDLGNGTWGPFLTQ